MWTHGLTVLLTAAASVLARDDALDLIADGQQQFIPYDHSSAAESVLLSADSTYAAAYAHLERGAIAQRVSISHLLHQ